MAEPRVAGNGQADLEIAPLDGGNMGIWLLGIATVFAPIGIWAGYQFHSELRVHHPAEWEHLGHSEYFPSNQEQRRWPTFLITRRYAKLGNRRLTGLGDVFTFWFLFT